MYSSNVNTTKRITINRSWIANNGHI